MMIDIFQLIRLGDTDSINDVIETFNINIVNGDKQNLLQEAISNNKEDIAVRLIELGIDINNKDNRGFSPLHYCGLYKNPLIAKCIIDKGCDINILDIHGNNPLWTAVFNARGYYDVVKMIAMASGDFYSKNKYGKSPLDFAIQIGDEYIINLNK